MKKIAITGASGAGKTTLAGKLKRILNLEVSHVDSLFWKENWMPTTEEERKNRLEMQLQKESWIIEGDGDGSSLEAIYERRFDAADTIVWLDLPRSVCLWRVMKRFYEYKDRNRSDLPPGCREDWRSDGFRQLLQRIWNYPTEYRPLVREKLEGYCGVKRVFILRTPAEVQNFVEAIARVNDLSSAANQKPTPETSVRPKFVPSVATS